MAKFLAKGATLSWDEPVGGDTDFVQLSSIGVSFSRDSIEVTTHDTSGLWHENLKGFKSGEVSFEGIFDPADATHANTDGFLRDLEDDSAIHTWKVTFADTGATEWTFDGILTGFEVTNDINDAARFSGTVAIEGAPTLA